MSGNFGDGGFSTEEDPVHAYSADGDYTVDSLTAMDDDMLSDQDSQVIFHQFCCLYCC